MILAALQPGLMIPMDLVKALINALAICVFCLAVHG